MKTKTYILKIDCLDGDDVTRSQHEILDENAWNVEELDALYAIICVGPQGAEIIDDGYRTLEEAEQAWPEAIAARPINDARSLVSPKRSRH